MLKTGKLIKLSFIKSLTYPKANLSNILLKMPESKSEVKNKPIVDIFFTFLITKKNSTQIATTEKDIKKSLYPSKRLKAAPSF